jgi:hypothetical protein
MTRPYHYVGPAEIRGRTGGRPAGTRIGCLADLVAWVCQTGRRLGPDGVTAATFVIDAEGSLLLADRRSEQQQHVELPLPVGDEQRAFAQHTAARREKATKRMPLHRGTSGGAEPRSL